jgi:hypothetical protein
MMLLALDPGQTCGWALFWVPEDKPAVLKYDGETLGTPASLAEMWYRAGVLAELVIIEDWTRNDTSVDARLALHPTGMMMMLAHQDHVPVRLQLPQFRRSIGDTAEGLGPYWRPNLKKHDDRRQAIRHGLAFIVHVMHHLPTTQVLFPR